MKQSNDARRKKPPVVARKRKPEEFFRGTWNGKRQRKTGDFGKMRFN
jgi:hypothetical protein